MADLDDDADLLMRQKMQTFFKPRTSNVPTSNNGQKGKGVIEEPISALPSSFGFIRPAPVLGYVKPDSVPTTTPMMEKLQSTFLEVSSQRTVNT
ncbi:hypothetical protein R1flu_001096 [Riccia fluitans]|uniref:Uncharacterized protein n=1 Tax=Riccia fluitans TaxID=41844 RepID=A0ABD1Y2A5_9MARC